jgi:Flp pilus assembly CpaE family ATPase
LDATLFIGGAPEFIQECKQAAAGRVQVVGEAVSPHDLYILIDKVNPDGLLVPSTTQWLDAALALAKTRQNLMVFVSGPMTAKEWNRLAKNKVISVSVDPAEATRNAATALSRLPVNRFRFEVQEIQPRLTETPELTTVIPSKTIAVYSAKGGVGKTTIAENMAAAFGMWANNHAERTGVSIRVALLDFNLDGSTGVYTWCPKENPKTASLWRDLDRNTLKWSDISGAMNYNKQANVWYLAPPIMPEEKMDFDQSLIDTILTGCKKYFHIIIIDNGVALLGRDAAISVLSSSSDVLLVADFKYDTMRLLASAYRNEIKQLLGDPSKASLVLNRIQPKWFTTKDFMVAFAREAGAALPLKAELPEEPSFNTSEGEMKSVPLICMLPDAEFSHAVAGLCRAVSGVDLGWKAKPAKKRFILFDWIRRGQRK